MTPHALTDWLLRSHELFSGLERDQTPSIRLYHLLADLDRYAQKSGLDLAAILAESRVDAE